MSADGPQDVPTLYTFDKHAQEVTYDDSANVPLSNDDYSNVLTNKEASLVFPTISTFSVHEYNGLCAGWTITYVSGH